jgi:hypothetical protein
MFAPLFFDRESLSGWKRVFDRVARSRSDPVVRRAARDGDGIGLRVLRDAGGAYEAEDERREEVLAGHVILLRVL